MPQSLHGSLQQWAVFVRSSDQRQRPLVIAKWMITIWSAVSSLFEFGSNVSVIDDPNFVESSIIQEWSKIILIDQSICKETVHGLNYLLSPSCEW